MRKRITLGLEYTQKTMLFDDPNLLSNEEIREVLIDDGISLELVDNIIQQFWIHDWGNSFLADEGRLELLKNFLEENESQIFSRFDFYSYFYSKVVPNFETINVGLQKIALVFEQMQTDQVAKGELEEILKELGGDISIIDLVREKLISISEKDNKVIVKWTHHTLTEFLSAAYILNHENFIETVERFMSTSESGAITFISSWTGTLRFLIEQRTQTFIDWLVEKLGENPDFLTDQISEVIVFTASPSLSEEYKAKLFRLIYDTYQNKKWWIPVWVYQSLYKLINTEIYQSLKDNADNENYEYRGNIAATVDGLLRNNHPSVTSNEKNFWKHKLIEYANSQTGNGVLQRHSLAALENFEGESDIIDAVAENCNSTDSLVREAFISMCKAVNPNYPTSIECFIKGISEDNSHIYARNALYGVNSADGIKTFLRGIADNQQFIHEFLDKESIFNKDDGQADHELILNIQNNLEKEIVTLLKKTIINAFTGDKNYRAGDSYFLKQLALLVKSKESNYLNEIVATIQELPADAKGDLFINDFEGVLSVLLDVENLDHLKTVFNDNIHHHAGYTLAEAVRLAPRNGNPNGIAVLQKGIELDITSVTGDTRKHDEYKKEQDLKIYKQFQKYLSPPTNGQYFPQVFKWFTENQKVIEAHWDDTEKERLLNLAVESNLNKIDPLNFEVHYNDQETKSGEYTITSLAAYFSDVLQVVYRLYPELLRLPENRTKIINYIPFAYLSDFKDFQEILGEITDEEIASLNKVMLDKTKDVRYLIPQTYIYIAKIYSGINSAKDVLLSFIEDERISESDREYALKTLERYITSADIEVQGLLESLWKPDERNKISDLANGLLISVFRMEEAVGWRIELLKTSATPFHQQEGAHSVGELEYELDSMMLAQPVIELKDERYMGHIVDLLDFSLTILEREGYWNYVNYLWKIAIAYVVREDFLLSPSALQQLRDWAETNKELPNINWFNKRLEQSTLNTSQKLGRTKSFKLAIEEVK